MSFKFLTVIATSVALALTGCASTSGSGDDYDYSDADPSLTKDEANFFSESGWTACAVGAGAGALACIIRGGNAKDMLTCAAIAVPVGCGLFMGGNYLLDELRVNYKTKEAQLNHMSSLVKKDNEKLASLNKSATDLLARDKAALAQMEKDLTKGTITADDMHIKATQMDSNIKFLNESIKVAQERLKTYNQTRDELLTNQKGGKESLSAADKKALAALDKQIAM